MTLSLPLPKHLQDNACYICGGGTHPTTATHEYWANTDAAEYFRTADCGQADDGYVEARYVDEYVGR